MNTIRQDQLLSDLLKSKKAVTAQKLAEKLNVSEKTIRNDLSFLERQLNQHGAHLVSKRGIGYVIDIKNQAEFQQFLLRQENARHHKFPDMSQQNVRLLYLLKRFLSVTDYLKADDLAEELYLSKFQLSNDLNMVRGFLAPFHLKLHVRPHYGIQLIGSEFNKRKCIANLISKNDDDSDILEVAEYTTLLEYEQEIQEILKRNQYQFTELTVKNLLTYLYIIISRQNQGHQVQISIENIEKLKNSEEQKIALSLKKLVEPICHIQFNEAETAYLVMHLSGNRVIEDDTKSDQDSFVNQDAFELVDEILSYINRTMQIDLTDDMDLKRNLALHLITVVRRIEYNMTIENPMLEDIKYKIIFGYEVACVASHVINNIYSCELDENEIGYLALHFSVALGRQKKVSVSKKRILLVCSTGRGTARLLKHTFTETFKEYLESIHMTDSYSISDIDISNYDLIITTVPLNLHDLIPVIQVEPFISKKELAELRRFFENEKRLKANIQYFDEHLFFKDLTLKTKEEVLAFMCQEVEAYKDVLEGFCDSVLLREKLASTEFANMIAMPHPHVPMSRESFVAIAILDKPIQWDKQKIQLVFMLSIEENQGADLDDLYAVITKLLSRDNIKALMKKPQYETLISIINHISDQDHTERE